MMTRCKSCLTKAEPLNGLCSVCGIKQEKKRAELTPTEKKVRIHALGIRIAAMIHLIGAAICIILLPEFNNTPLITLIAVINACLAYGLISYSLIAYKAAVTFYFMLGMVGVVSIQKGAVFIAWIIVALFALYLIGNVTSKAIFERRLPDNP